MKRNAIIYILFTSVIAGFSSCCSDGDVRLSWVEQTDKYAVWKGERKGLQAELVTLRDLEKVSLKVSDMDCGNASIPSSSIKAQFISYVMADVLNEKTYGQCDWRPSGKYDSLMVADVIDTDTVREIGANTVQPIWMTIKVPQTAQPGRYRGKLTVRSGWRHWTLPFEIDVLGKTLPEPREWKFHLDLWQNPYSVARYHNVELWSTEHFNAMRPVMKLLAEAGQKAVTATILDRPWDGQTEDAFGSMVVKTLYPDGRWEYDFSVFDKWVEFMFSLGIDRQINCYSMIPWKLTFDYVDGATGKTEYINAIPGSAGYADYWRNFISAFAKHLKEKGWFEKTYIAMDERPMEDMKLAMDVIRSAEPEFKVSLAGYYHPELAYDIRDYSITFKKSFPDEVKARRKELGMTTTFYTCCSEAHPNTFTVSNPLEAVWLGWFAFANGYDGYLRWAYNSWTKDPLKDTRYERWAAGDCFIIYPEGRSSVRFEHLVEGIQDYEKVRIMVEKWKEEGNEGALIAVRRALEGFTLERLLEEGPQDALEMAKGLINQPD